MDKDKKAQGLHKSAGLRKMILKVAGQIYDVLMPIWGSWWINSFIHQSQLVDNEMFYPPMVDKRLPLSTKENFNVFFVKFLGG